MCVCVCVCVCVYIKYIIYTTYINNNDHRGLP